MQKIVFLFLTLLLATGAGQAQTNTPPAGGAQGQETETVKWHSIDEVLALSAQTPKKIFIDVYTHWCGWCKVMDQKTFTHPKLAAYLNRYFYPVKFNAEQKEDILFGNRTFTFMPEYRAHELAIALMNGKMSYPTTVYLNEKGDLMSAVPGYQEPKNLFPILVFFAENYYTKMSWEDFSQNVWPSKEKELSL
jgi:thioredoxin-related protein